MNNSHSKTLVIDASVARAAGDEEATHPTSVVARNFLQEVLTIRHKAIMTPAIRDEWDIHQSNFARKWRRIMLSKKKLILTNLEKRLDLRKKVETKNISQIKKTEMLKDFHLIEAAIATDRRIISLDDSAQKLFCDLSKSFTEMQDVLWVNPVSGAEYVISWLKKGAPNEDQWKLHKD